MSATRSLLQQLESNRKSKIISLVYSNGASMEDDDVDIVNEILEKLTDGKKIDTIEMIVSSLGGDANAAYSIAKLTRRYCDKFNVILPRRAKSGASLLSLGSDKIIMSKIAELGPIDPIVSHPMLPSTMIPARCCPYFIESVLPKVSRMGVEDYFLKVDYAHVGYCMMAVELARDYAKRLLTSFHFKDQPDKVKSIEDLIKKLTGYPSHGFVIDIDEAKELGLNVEELNEDDWKILSSLYKKYQEELNDIGMVIETSIRTHKLKRPKPTIW